MQPLTIAATALTPAIHFDYGARTLLVRGESYPENVGAFYGPILAALHPYLDGAAQRREAVRVEFDLTYINSASTKSFQQLLAMLDTAARCGACIEVRWVVDPQDDALTELGEDLLCDKQWLSHAIVHRT